MYYVDQPIGRSAPSLSLHSTWVSQGSVGECKENGHKSISCPEQALFDLEYQSTDFVRLGDPGFDLQIEIAEDPSHLRGKGTAQTPQTLDMGQDRLHAEPSSS